MAMTLTWTDEPKEGRYYTMDGKFAIDRIRRSWFVLTQRLEDGSHRIECKGSLKVCKAFAQDMRNKEAEMEATRLDLDAGLEKVDSEAPGTALEQLGDVDPEAAARLLGY